MEQLVQRIILSRVGGKQFGAYKSTANAGQKREN